MCPFERRSNRAHLSDGRVTAPTRSCPEDLPCIEVRTWLGRVRPLTVPEYDVGLLTARYIGTARGLAFHEVGWAVGAPLVQELTCEWQDAGDRASVRISDWDAYTAQMDRQLLDKLGSKRGSPSGDPLKAPYSRAVIARRLPWAEVSQHAKDVLRRWFEGAMRRTEAEAVLRAMGS
jgi:hypothetical protein